MRAIEREPGKEYVLSLSYGKDSMACLFAIEQLGWPLDRIVHAEVWATDTIPADLPPMVEFKAHADAIIKERWGIEVEHVCAMRDGKKVTYADLFYHEHVRISKTGGYLGSQLCEGLGATAASKSRRCDGHTKSEAGARSSSPHIYGWPHQVGGWCKRFKKNYLFDFAPWAGRGDKYRPVPWYCIRRAGADHPSHKAGLCSTAGRDRMG